jgi:aspartate racemase
MIPLPRSRESAGQPLRRSLGVIGSLVPRAHADFLLRLLEAIDRHSSAQRFDIVVEEPARARQPVAAADSASSRQLDVFDMTAALARRGVGLAVLPCFDSLQFLEELKVNSPLPVADILEALRAHIREEFGGVRRVGVICPESLRVRRVFERYFAPGEFSLLYAHLPPGDSVAALRVACVELVRQGAELIIPAVSASIPLIRELGPVAVPVLDAHAVYARSIVNSDPRPAQRPFKLGVVGGVGPAATVDFLRKLISNTPVHRDQEHLKVLVEQNPQIPDRTDYLLGKGADPTLALYATCKKLHAGEADLIAIPCNTAHAFIDTIQPHLDIPIINMLTATVSHIREIFPTLHEVGLLATTGTLSSGIYHRALHKEGFREVVPSPAMQEHLMNAIYGRQGIKAGFTSGECVQDVHAVIEELVARGVRVVILGCTELPLVFSQHEITSRGGQRIKLIDPTEILALRCVSQAMARSRR